MISKFFRLKTHFIEAERDSGFGGGDFGGVSSASDVGGAGGAGVGGGGIGGAAGDSEGLQSRGSLTADLGGGLTAQVDPVTGRTTGFAGGSQEGVEAAELKARAAEAGRSVFGQKLVEKFGSPKAIGALGGAVFGALTGIGPAAGAQAGAAIGGSSLFTPEPAPTQQPGATRQQEIQQAQQQAGLGVSPTAESPLSLGPQELGIGQEGTQATQIAAAGRQSGIQPQLGQQPVQQAPQQPLQRFLNTQGAIPTVNIGAFPGALGRV